MTKYAIGTDIGGSHISAVIIDIEKKQLLSESFASGKVDNQASSEDILQSWKVVLEKTLKGIAREQLAGIGFAMPGPFDYESGVAMFTHEVAKYENLYGTNIGEKLRPLLGLSGSVAFRFMNDATSFAVGEAWSGKTSIYQKSIALTLGTGFGSAFIQAGFPVLEGDTVPKLGCVWHLPFKNGIADDYFSTRWYISRYAAMSGEVLPGVKEIAEHAENDPGVKSLFEEFGANLGEFLGPWVKKFGAEGIVIGGNMTKAWDLFGPAFMASLKGMQMEVNIHLSELGESAAMIGSARLMDEAFWKGVKPLLSKM